MIKVWGRATSSNVQTVVWALAELGLDFERYDVGGVFGGNRTPEFLVMNPNGLVPVVQIGETYLWESGAVVRCLGALHGDEAFWPADPVHRATLDRWGEWTKTTFVPAFITNVFWPCISKREGERDEDAIRAGAEKLKAVARILDGRLATSDYIGGDTLCFADIITGALLYRYFDLDFERADLPNLRAYYDRLTKRPAYAEHVMISYDSLRAK